MFFSSLERITTGWMLHFRIGFVRLWLSRWLFNVFPNFMSECYQYDTRARRNLFCVQNQSRQSPPAPSRPVPPVFPLTGVCGFTLLLLLQVEIAPPLLGKFQSLVLDNRDLAGLARCLPPDGGGGDHGANNTGGAGFANDAQQQQQQQRDRSLRPDFLPSNMADVNSGYNYAVGRLGSGGGGGGDDGDRSPPQSSTPAVMEHTLPLDSPCDNSLLSFGSSTSIAEDEVGCVPVHWAASGRPAGVHTGMYLYIHISSAEFILCQYE